MGGSVLRVQALRLVSVELMGACRWSVVAACCPVLTGKRLLQYAIEIRRDAYSQQPTTEEM